MNQPFFHQRWSKIESSFSPIYVTIAQTIRNEKCIEKVRPSTASAREKVFESCFYKLQNLAGEFPMKIDLHTADLVSLETLFWQLLSIWCSDWLKSTTRPLSCQFLMSDSPKIVSTSWSIVKALFHLRGTAYIASWSLVAVDFFIFSPPPSWPIFPRHISLEGKTLLVKISVFFFTVYSALALSDGLDVLWVLECRCSYEISLCFWRKDYSNDPRARGTLLDFIIF